MPQAGLPIHPDLHHAAGRPRPQGDRHGGLERAGDRREVAAVREPHQRHLLVPERHLNPIPALGVGGFAEGDSCLEAEVFEARIRPGRPTGPEEIEPAGRLLDLQGHRHLGMFMDFWRHPVRPRRPRQGDRRDGPFRRGGRCGTGAPGGQVGGPRQGADPKRHADPDPRHRLNDPCPCPLDCWRCGPATEFRRQRPGGARDRAPVPVGKCSQGLSDGSGKARAGGHERKRRLVGARGLDCRPRPSRKADFFADGPAA